MTLKRIKEVLEKMHIPVSLFPPLY